MVERARGIHSEKESRTPQVFISPRAMERRDSKWRKGRHIKAMAIIDGRKVEILEKRKNTTEAFLGIHVPFYRLRTHVADYLLKAKGEKALRKMLR